MAGTASGIPFAVLTHSEEKPMTLTEVHRKSNPFDPAIAQRPLLPETHVQDKPTLWGGRLTG